MKANKLKSILLLMGIFFSINLSAFEVDGIEYMNVAYGGLQVQPKDGGYSGDIIIPEEVSYNGNTYKVTSIYGNQGSYSSSGAFYNCTNLTSITIPKTITRIGDSAFYGCSKLTAVKINDLSAWCNISFGNYMSNPCHYAHHLILNEQEIKNLTIPNDITEIKAYAFYGCNSLNSLTIPNTITTIGISAFYECSGLQSLIIPNGVLSVGTLAFSRCSGLQSLNISESVTEIGSSAFSHCTGLITLNIPNSVISIGDDAFAACWGLKSINIPNNINSIEKGLFSGCSGLTSITIPNSVTSIGEEAFSGCSKLTSIIIPDGVKSIGKNAFDGCIELKTIKISSNITSIGSGAFSGCKNLEIVNISNLSAWCNINFAHSTSNPCYYANHIFLNTQELINLSIPDNVLTINAFSFYGCNTLNSLIIPNSVTTIGNFAFSGCNGLKSITIGNNVMSIGYNSFENCNSLTEVTVRNPNPVSIGSQTFSNSKNATLYVPQGSKAAYEAADVWKEFKEIVEITKSSYLEVADTVGFTGKQLVLPIELKNTDEIAGVQFNLTLPAGVSVALNSKNKLMFSKTERDADHTLSGSKAEDGSYTVLLYSADTEAITGNEGSIIDVTLDIDKEMKDGTYEIKISDIVLSTTKAVKINGDDVTAQLEVKSYLLGDPNNDGSIDVVDITMIANHILGNNPENFIFAAADVDVDGIVDVNDIISIANIILYGSSSNAKPSMAKASNHLANNVTSNESNGDGFTVKNVSVEKGGTVKVDFELTNAAHDFSGIQMDIDLGEGLSFATKSNGKVNVTKGARLEDEDFTLSVAKQEGNQYRALGYYTDGSVIPEKSGTLFTLTLQADDSLADGKTFNCQLDNITLSTKNNEKIQQETQTFTVTIGDATGISDLFNEDCTPAVIYDLTGKRIETPAKSGQVIIIKKDGKVVKVFKK